MRVQGAAAAELRTAEAATVSCEFVMICAPVALISHLPVSTTARCTTNGPPYTSGQPYLNHTPVLVLNEVSSSKFNPT